MCWKSTIRSKTNSPKALKVGKSSVMLWREDEMVASRATLLSINIK